ncbi:mitochondrial carrier domain-containing protein [Obelidium mucronatum]|nr:mitochondrial carrier domain-containing protein [Obelidium mucronatum]
MTSASPSTDLSTSAYNFAHRFLQDRDALRLALAGAASGLVSAAMVTPLDVVKIRLQNQYYSPGIDPKYRGTIPTLTKIWREEGVRGLFSGLGPSVYAYLPDRIIWFSVYHEAKRTIAKELGTAPEGTTAVHLLATLSASVACTVAVSPLWVVRTRLMAQSTIPGEPHSFHYTSTGQAFSTIIKSEGWSALYKGLGPSLLGVSHSLIMFPLYERLKVVIKEGGHGTNADGTLTNSSILIASSISKCIASLATYPHEVIRTRLQTQKTHIVVNNVELVDGKTTTRTTKAAVEPKYRGVIQTAQVLIREEGAISLYRGLTTSIIRQVPAGAISLWIYELVLKL